LTLLGLFQHDIRSPLAEVLHVDPNNLVLLFFAAEKGLDGWEGDEWRERSGQDGVTEQGGEEEEEEEEAVSYLSSTMLTKIYRVYQP
jgi:hypothetical protein